MSAKTKTIYKKAERLIAEVHFLIQNKAGIIRFRANMIIDFANRERGKIHKNIV